MGNDRIERIIDKYRGDAGALIQALLEIQRENHWLPKEVLWKVSEELKVPLSHVQHVATFYKAFSLVPSGYHEIRICNGTACHVHGSQRLLDRVQDILGIKPGETNLDLKFSLKIRNCLGCCASGPVMVVDGKHHIKMTPIKAEELLKKTMIKGDYAKGRFAS